MMLQALAVVVNLVVFVVAICFSMLVEFQEVEGNNSTTAH